MATKTWRVPMTEKRTVHVNCIVEADTAEDAIEAVHAGDGQTEDGEIKVDDYTIDGANVVEVAPYSIKPSPLDAVVADVAVNSQPPEQEPRKKRFRQDVVEMRSVMVTYVVEADSEDEAAELIAMGETVEERERSSSMEVVNRSPHGPITEEGK